MPEGIGSIRPTLIPSLTEVADIQTAFRFYHYGSTSAPASIAAASNTSMVGILRDLLVNANIVNPSITSGTLVAPTIQNPSVTGGIFVAGTFTSSPTITNPTINNPSVTSGTFVTPTLQNPSVTSGTFIAGTFTSSPIITTPTINNPSVTSGTFTVPSLVRPVITGTTQMAQVLESVSVTSFSTTGTVVFNVLDQGAVVFYTSSSSANWVLNVTGSATTSLNNMITTGQSLTISNLVTNGAGASRYMTAIQIDGSSVTSSTRWQGGTAPTLGNTSSIDIYSLAIVKVATTSSVADAFRVFASQTRFA